MIRFSKLTVKQQLINLLLHFVGEKTQLGEGARLVSCTNEPQRVVMPDQAQVVNGGNASHLDPSFLANFVRYSKKYRIVILDTPGFDHSSLSDDMVLNKIAVSLQHSYVLSPNAHKPRTNMWVSRLDGSNKAVLGGLIYLEDVSQIRLSNPRKNLEALERRCGEVAFDKVSILVATTTRGVPISQSEREKKEKLLQEGHLRLMIRNGTKVDRLESDNGGRNAWEAVFQVLRRIDQRGGGTRDVVLM
jgi:hypothetical protein